MKLFRKSKKSKEIEHLKEILSSFEENMFDRLTELENNLENVRKEDQKGYKELLGKEDKKIESIGKLTREILRSVELLEKNQILLSEELANLKTKIKM